MNVAPFVTRQRRATAARAARQDALEPIFAGWSRAAYWFGVACWLAALAYFWTWWLQPAHVISTPAFIMTTATVAWVTLIPAYFIFIFVNAKRMKPSAAVPPGRIAMVVTKAPSEPFEVVRKTLLGHAGSERRRVRHLACRRGSGRKRRSAGAPGMASSFRRARALPPITGLSGRAGRAARKATLLIFMIATVMTAMISWRSSMPTTYRSRPICRKS